MTCIAKKDFLTNQAYCIYAIAATMPLKIKTISHFCLYQDSFNNRLSESNKNKQLFIWQLRVISYSGTVDKVAYLSTD